MDELPRARTGLLDILAAVIRSGTRGAVASEVGVSVQAMDAWARLAIEAGFPVERRADGKRAVRFRLSLTDTHDALLNTLGRRKKESRRREEGFPDVDE